MSSLQRYKKSGGFVQLLALIESFGPQKKEKFIEMIEVESPVWASAIREKMITIERILSWPDDVLISVFRKMQPKSLAFALEGLEENHRKRISSTFSPSETRRLNDILTESKPKPEEISTTLFKAVDLARKMIKDRELAAEKFDETLLIPEDYEAFLEAESTVAYGVRVVENNEAAARAQGLTVTNETVHGPPPGSATPEMVQLQRSLALMMKENKALKEEIQLLRDRLDQIRRIA